MNKISYEELVAFHPGYYVKDMIEDEGMNQDELAKRLQTSGKYVSDLLNGRINLTDEMALKLSIVFGTSVSLWLNLNKTYIEKKLEIEKRRQEDKECELVKKLDYKFWVDLKLVEPARRTTDKVQELQRYFRVASLDVLQRKDFLVQYRTGVAEASDINIMNANAWVQTAINIGKQIQVQPFDKKKLNAILPEIRRMTTHNVEGFVIKLKEMLAQCGVALVILPNLKNCGVNGAVKWLSKEKVILAINDRRKYADTFWFSLFHELGHVMQQRIKVLMISEEKALSEKDELLQRLEEEADAFAQNILIPENEYRTFVEEHPYFTEEDIILFADRMEIHPGIILGRLQMEKRVPYNTLMNGLKEKYYFE